MEQVKIKNISGGNLSIYNEETRGVRSFSPNAVKTMSLDEVKNLYLGDDGFAYMIKEKYVEIVNPTEEIGKFFDIDFVQAKPLTPQQLIALKPSELHAKLSNLAEGEKLALEKYVEQNNFPMEIAGILKAFYGKDFIQLQMDKQEEKAEKTATKKATE